MSRSARVYAGVWTAMAWSVAARCYFAAGEDAGAWTFVMGALAGGMLLLGVLFALIAVLPARVQK